jgi:dTDP-4-dehydrorhamnose reductase
MMRPFLVTGAEGQVGFELRRSLAAIGDVVACGRAEMDLESEASILAALEAVRSRVVLNAAAYTAVDRAESDRDRAMAVNATAPGIIARWAANNGCTIFHYSTDYVFDRTKNSPYFEADQTNPQSVYGKSKWEGEETVRRAGADHLILRTSRVYCYHGNNFLKTILRLAGKREALRIVADQMGAPTSAAVIADTTTSLVQHLLSGKPADGGTFHLTAQGSATWYDYACYLVDCATAEGFTDLLPVHKIEPSSTIDYPTPARRPLSSRLSCARPMDCFDIALPPWQEGVAEVINRLVPAA